MYLKEELEKVKNLMLTLSDFTAYRSKELCFLQGRGE